MIVYEAEPRLVGLQKITPDGAKRFNKGMEKIGAACRLGEIPLDGRLSVVVEGYATGRSIRMATNEAVPVVVAFDAGGLLPAARLIRAAHPDQHLLFCADDDWAVEQRLQGYLADEYGYNDRIGVDPVRVEAKKTWFDLRAARKLDDRGIGFVELVISNDVTPHAGSHKALREHGAEARTRGGGRTWQCERGVPALRRSRRTQADRLQRSACRGGLARRQGPGLERRARGTCAGGGDASCVAAPACGGASRRPPVCRRNHHRSKEPSWFGVPAAARAEDRRQQGLAVARSDGGKRRRDRAGRQRCAQACRGRCRADRRTGNVRCRRRGDLAGHRSGKRCADVAATFAAIGKGFAAAGTRQRVRDHVERPEVVGGARIRRVRRPHHEIEGPTVRRGDHRRVDGSRRRTLCVVARSALFDQSSRRRCDERRIPGRGAQQLSRRA